MSEATGLVWFQLYVYKDREATLSLVQRAASAGCKAIALTVDAQIWGRRERDIKNRFRLPEGLSIKNLMPAGKEQFPKEQADSGLAAYVTWQFDPTLSWISCVKILNWPCGCAAVLRLQRYRRAWLAKQHGYCFFLKLAGLRSYFFNSSYKSALYLPANLAACAIFPSVSSMSWRR